MTRGSIVFILLALCGLFGIAMGATLTQSFTYQGTLANSGGTPLNGNYQMTFNLYGVASGGSSLATYGPVSVTVTKGQFTTPVTFDSSFFDGRALWLGIKVGADPEMTPRQEIRPVPYALGLRPGMVGSSFTTSQAGTGFSDLVPGVDISTGYEYNPGVRISTIGASSDALSVVTNNDDSYGLYAMTSGDNSYGVSAMTGGYNSDGIVSSTDGDWSDGVVCMATGNNAHGMRAQTSGRASPAAWAEAWGPESQGVAASSAQDVAIYGKGMEGGYFTTNQAGSHDPDTGPVYYSAVNASTTFAYNPGIITQTTGDNSYGIKAITHGPNSIGVEASSVMHTAVYAWTGRTDGKWGLYTPNYIYAKGTQVPSSDVAEYMPVAEDVEPGTVLVIGEDGRLHISTSSYDTGVAGIVSTAPGLSLGIKEKGNPGEALIAVAGRVPCKVDASNGPIHPRDLLTTSNNPGYAMKATDPKVGTVLGKAIGSLESGTGTIEVLVTLQ